MIYDIDVAIINFLQKIAMPVSRLAIFVIFFWFGLLKVIGFSPAEGLVESLLQTTMPFIEPATFMICFGLFEMLIGIMFLVKGLEREVIPLLAFHMFTTFMPLFLLPSIMWTQAFVPTLEGQYIIKNLMIIATAIGIAAHLHPIKHRIN
ncbi:hypothetical protein EXS61_00160 [Candidatus Parcubacteria bacterium]|nr:hypothetical protein [Candidatus Parcubacteria bacterium]